MNFTNSKWLLGTSLLIIAAASHSDAWARSLSLQEKLARQFARYQMAQDWAVEVVGEHDGTIARHDWERLLAGSPEERFTSEDLARLAAAQEKIIRANAQLARESSVLDLDQIRGNAERTASFCADLPKGGLLHVHPSGTADRATVSRLMDAADPTISYQKVNKMVQGSFYPPSYSYLQAYPELVPYASMPESDRDATLDLFFLRPGHHPFSEFDGLFVINSLYQTTSSAQEVYGDFLERARTEHVRYVEFTRRSGWGRIRVFIGGQSGPTGQFFPP